METVRHHLKTWPLYFEQVLRGTKTFEVRYNDRSFAPGETVILEEFHPIHETYTGRQLQATIGAILAGGFGLHDGYCAFSLLDVAVIQAEKAYENNNNPY